MASRTRRRKPLVYWPEKGIASHFGGTDSFDTGRFCFRASHAAGDSKNRAGTLREIEIFIPAVETIGVRNYQAPFLPVAQAVARPSSFFLSHPFSPSPTLPHALNLLRYSPLSLSANIRLFHLIGAAAIRTTFPFPLCLLLSFPLVPCTSGTPVRASSGSPPSPSFSSCLGPLSLASAANSER